MIQKIASSDQPQGNGEMTRAEAVAAKPVLLTELNELRNSIEMMIRDYENQFGEKFERARAANMDNHTAGSSRPQMSPSPPKQRQTQQPLSQTQPQSSGFSSQRSPQQPRRTPPSHKSPPPASNNRF
mmetsp:Transcript_11616/g.18951  ORF Transcript_11616/g.18951 Transcript_11616/m.18951 type:complete len:127 (-) Transcript_11616:176-556(-)